MRTISSEQLRVPSLHWIQWQRLYWTTQRRRFTANSCRQSRAFWPQTIPFHGRPNHRINASPSHRLLTMLGNPTKHYGNGTHLPRSLSTAPVPRAGRPPAHLTLSQSITIAAGSSWQWFSHQAPPSPWTDTSIIHRLCAGACTILRALRSVRERRAERITSTSIPRLVRMRIAYWKQQPIYVTQRRSNRRPGQHTHADQYHANEFNRGYGGVLHAGVLFSQCCGSCRSHRCDVIFFFVPRERNGWKNEWSTNMWTSRFSNPNSISHPSISIDTFHAWCTRAMCIRIFTARCMMFFHSQTFVANAIGFPANRPSVTRDAMHSNEEPPELSAKLQSYRKAAERITTRTLCQHQSCGINIIIILIVAARTCLVEKNHSATTSSRSNRVVFLWARRNE